MIQIKAPPRGRKCFTRWTDRLGVHSCMTNALVCIDTRKHAQNIYIPKNNDYAIMNSCLLKRKRRREGGILQKGICLVSRQTRSSFICLQHGSPHYCNPSAVGGFAGETIKPHSLCHHRCPHSAPSKASGMQCPLLVLPDIKEELKPLGCRY